MTCVMRQAVNPYVLLLLLLLLLLCSGGINLMLEAGTTGMYHAAGGLLGQLASAVVCLGPAH